MADLVTAGLVDLVRRRWPDQRVFTYWDYRAGMFDGDIGPLVPPPSVLRRRVERDDGAVFPPLPPLGDGRCAGRVDVQERRSFLEIRHVEAFREPPVHAGEHVCGLRGSLLISQETAQAGRGTELE